MLPNIFFDRLSSYVLCGTDNSQNLKPITPVAMMPSILNFMS